MILANLLSTEEDIKKLMNSQKLIVYISSFSHVLDNETTHVVLINEKHEPFLVINEPYDDPFWGEIDRISICYDENYREELLEYYSKEKNDWRSSDENYIKRAEIHNPKLSVYRREYDAFSIREKCKEQIQEDFALLLESEHKNVLIYCSELVARLYVIEDMEEIKEVLADAVKII